ncbi:hypothetical protein [Aestuariicoccus sp. MJ-SS9]|uniref:hypothetical protein n=1 Tax=Aestuariicoccus sp. MJ-SS9 TaxID=3079855 RepID=UPI0029151E17|nr:hypothetical protein [Aestuariicoccus sp. MJ-SS9]MDU8913943.1 hypothetical protein [Aestuariicoccus sp. MJ-SS9]
MGPQKADPKLIQKAQDVILEHRPEFSMGHAHLWAEAICDAMNGTEFLHHKGKEDRGRLKAILTAVDALEKKLAATSQWVQEELDTQLIQQALPRSDFDDRGQISSLEIVNLALGELRAAALRTEETMKSAKSHDGLNWRAVAVIDETQRMWTEHGKTVPPNALGRDAHYAEFLAALFEALSIGAEVTSAFKAWRRTASDGRTPLAPPRS